MIEKKKSTAKPNEAISIFGTDGIRGCANRYPITPEVILRIGQAIGIFFKNQFQQPKILIGKDTRKSGYFIEQALSAGICSVGGESYFLGPLPTPGIAYLTRGMRASAGIVISASHNPYRDNGIKIFASDGYKLPDEAEKELEQLIHQKIQLHERPIGNHIGISQRIDDAIGQYAVFLKEQFPKHLTLEGLRIVVDCAQGSSYKVAPKVLTELGAEVVTIHDQPNGININEHCGALHPQSLIKHVHLHRANIGLALDGDADRLLVVDEKGELLDGDEILAICGIDYLKNNRLNKNILVSTILSNMGLDLALQKHKGKVIRTNVGDRHVVTAMRNNGLNLGGEQSGHLIFRDCSTTGDGILAALSLLEVILENQKPLSELKKVMEKLPQVQKSIRILGRVPLEEMPELSKKVSMLNKDLNPEGRVLFRYSGTELKARILVEGSDHKKITTHLEELAEITKKNINTYYEQHHPA